jgi:hypothetical protein
MGKEFKEGNFSIFLGKKRSSTPHIFTNGIILVERSIHKLAVTAEERRQRTISTFLDS